MSKLTFNEEEYRPTVSRNIPAHTGLTGLLIKKGWAKSSSQATFILLIILGICLVFFAFSLWSGGGDEIEYVTTPDNLEDAGGPNDPGLINR